MRMSNEKDYQDLYIGPYVKKLTNQAHFLKHKGFVLKAVCDYSIVYKKDNCEVSLYIGRYSDLPEIAIDFNLHNQALRERVSIDWLHIVKKFNNYQDEIPDNPTANEKADALCAMLDYLKMHFNTFTDIELAIEERRREEEAKEKHWAKTPSA